MAKGKGRGGKKAAAEPVDPAKLEMIEMVKESARLTAQRAAEEEAISSFQRQRERVNYFWIVDKKALEDRRAELRRKEREVQDLEEQHATEIRVLKQRVKQLLQEYNDEMTKRKVEGEVALKLTQDENRSVEAELKADRRALRGELSDVESSFKDYVKGMRKAQDRRTTELRRDFERKAEEVNGIYEERMKSLREDLENQRKAELQSIEDRKDAHIEALMKAHERAFSEITTSCDSPKVTAHTMRR